MTKQEILEDIRAKILNDHYPQGTSLVERDLCEHYNISRTPIREILWTLVSDGIVEQRPARGFAVVTLDLEQIFEIFQAREAVEGMAARIACERAPEKHIKNLERLRDELESLEITASNIEDGPRIGRLMHKEIIEASSNRLLKEIYVKLGCLSALTTNIAKQSLNTETASRKHHLAIMNAVISGDVEKSGDFMIEHLKMSCRNIIEMLYPHMYTMIHDKTRKASRNHERS